MKALILMMLLLVQGCYTVYDRKTGEEYKMLLLPIPAGPAVAAIQTISAGATIAGLKSVQPKKQWWTYDKPGGVK